MDLTLTLHLLAGLGALGFGGAILLRQPARLRNRLFALLCAALALWNLGVVGNGLGDASTRNLWRMLFLLGSCATAPLGLHFVLVLVGFRKALRRRIVLPSYLACAVLWLSAWRFAGSVDAWGLTAIFVLGSIFGFALTVLGWRAFSATPGPERDAFTLVLGGSVIGVAGGLSDFAPRTPIDLPRLGPLAVLLFLLIVCAVIVRYRFLDVHVFLTRAVALLAGGALTGMIFFGVALFTGNFLAFFGVGALLLLVAGPVGRSLREGAGVLLSPADPLVPALLQISRRLPRAESTEQVWRIIEDGRARLPSPIRVDLFVRHPELPQFQRSMRFGPGAGDEHREVEAASIGFDDPLCRVLSRERSPLTQRYLQREGNEAEGDRHGEAADALDRLQALELRMVIPLIAGAQIDGLIGVGGAIDAQHLTAEVATAFHAVGQQAAAQLERLEALELARRNHALAAVGEMAAGLAHEIRNPAAAIRGAAQAMADPAATPQQQGEMLEVIDEESARLERVVAEFLEYARPAPPRREALDLAAVVGRALRGLELAGRRLQSEVQVDQGTPPVLGDPDQLQRACENLVRNAWEATGDDGGLRVSLGPSASGGVVARFEDDGPGIDVEETGRLFQPFYTTKAGGTGLGLALIHRIVEGHGGRIDVDGRPGRGAAFTLTLPAATTVVD